MLVTEPFRAFQFDYKGIFHKNISEVLAYVMAFVVHRNGHFGFSSDTTNAEFFEKSTLIDFLEEPGAQRIRDFKDSAEHLSG